MAVGSAETSTQFSSRAAPAPAERFSDAESPCRNRADCPGRTQQHGFKSDRNRNRSSQKPTEVLRVHYAQGIRKLLHGYRGDVFEVRANEGRFDTEFLYVVLPYASKNVQLYVKMYLQRDTDDESLSKLWVVSLHEEGC